MLIYIALIESAEDKRKFELLYNNYKQLMFYVANRVLKDHYLSEDVVHQSFLRILKNLEKIDRVDSRRTKSFILVIVENIAIDYYRKRQNENQLSFDELEILIGYEDKLDDIILSDIEEAILKLPIIYSSVLRLRYSQGYNNEEIAEILNISQDNVRQRLSRGKKRLEELLNGKGVKING